MTGIEAFTSNAALLTAAQTAGQFSSRQSKKAEKPTKLSFADAIKKSQEEAQLTQEGLPIELAGMTEEEAVIFLKDRVDIAGDELRFKQSIENLMEYKTKISQLLKYISRNNYEIISKKRWLRPQNGRMKRDTVYQIRVINEHLNQLMTDTVYNQGKNLRLLARIGEINGLIVDLLQ